MTYFSDTFEENLEDYNFYFNIHKSGLYRVVCMYPTFPCRDMIHWIVIHIDLETMVLSSFSVTKLATFRQQESHKVYHLLQPVVTMDAPFTRPSSSVSSRDMLKR